MKNVNRDLIFRIVVSLLTFICIFLLFAPWIKLADGSIRKEAKSVLKQLDSGLKDVDRDDLKDLEEYFEEEDINISPKKILNKAKNVTGVIKDTSITPSESIKLFSGLKGLYKVVADEDIADSYVLRQLIPKSAREVFEEMGTAINLMIFLPILFFATLISAILVTVLHALNKKYIGISLVACSALSFIAYLVVVIKINSWSNDELFENLVRISAAPIWLLILSAGAMVIWMKKDEIGNLLFGKNPQSQYQTEYAQPKAASAPQMYAKPAGDVAFCANCGTKLEPDSAFCPECGTPRS